MGQFLEDRDPFAALTAPPEGETPEERKAREKHEADAKLVSAKIDDFLSQSSKKKKSVHVILLGQSESGKSTTLKNFQLRFSPKAWKQERLSWTSVIQLNLVRSINAILDLLHHEMTLRKSSDDEQFRLKTTDEEQQLRFTERHRLLKLSLTPIRGVQKDLEKTLGSGALEESPPVQYYLNIQSSGTVDDDDAMDFDQPHRRDPREFYVQASNSWKDRFRKRSGAKNGLKNERLEIASLIEGCMEDMKALWEDETIQRLLKKRKVRMEDSPGFFLNDIERIARRDYIPTDDDIIRSRLRTLGVQEHRFTFEEGHLAGYDWHIYDVGGARSSRAAWAPFFDNVDAIIFLAPLNCFDEWLVEDPRVNRLQDSYALWKSVVSNKLLAGSQVILFLNKYDLLQTKLDRGVVVSHYVPSYGNRANTTEAVVKYFEQHFRDTFKKYSPPTRPFFLHVTSVVDKEATVATLSIVEERIIRGHLQRADLL